MLRFVYGSMIVLALGPIVGAVGCEKMSDDESDDAATVEQDASVVADGSDGTNLCDETPAGAVTLPADDTTHPAEALEWWYWTGHLQTGDGRWFGFEEVFFSVSVAGVAGQMTNFAITDIEGGTFHDTNGVVVGAPAHVENGFDLAISPFTARGGDGHDALHGEFEGYVLDLDLQQAKAPVFQHGDGYKDYTAGGYTYYYSRERMDAIGTLTVDGEPLAVTGTAWFDHQYGDLPTSTGTGWDWFALTLDDNREIMLFILLAADGTKEIGGSLSDADCVMTELTDFVETATGEWTSPETGCTYPSGWELTVQGETYTVTPVLEGQEVVTAAQIYWEGAATVSVNGEAAGRAYVELTGYCP